MGRCWRCLYAWSRTNIRKSVLYLLERAIRSQGRTDITVDQIKVAAEIMAKSSWILAIFNGITYGMKPLLETIIIFTIMALFEPLKPRFMWIFRRCVSTKWPYILSALIVFGMIQTFGAADRPFNAFLPLSVGHILVVDNQSSWLYDLNLFIILDSLLLYISLRCTRKVRTATALLSMALINALWFAPKWIVL